MNSLSVWAGMAVWAAVATGAAAADSGTGREVAVRPVAWECLGQRCVGDMRPKPRPGALLRECQKVVEAIGPVSSYRSRGLELTPDELRRCNRYATQTPVSLR